MFSTFSKKSFFSLLIILICYQTFSQKNILLSTKDSFPFNHFEFYNWEKLKGRETYWIMQDRHGFIWVENDNGLKRFDGYTFKSWSYSANDPNALVSGQCLGMAEDKNGLIWMPSTRKGLYCFDPYHEKFTNYHHQPGNSNSPIDNTSWAIQIDSNGIVWTGTPSGLDKFNPVTKTFTHFLHRENDSTTLTNNDIVWVEMEYPDAVNKDKAFLWIINEKLGIDCFDLKKEKVIKHFDFPFPFKSRWGGGGDFDIYVMGIKNNVFWIGSNDRGIYGFNTLKEQFIYIHAPHPCYNTLHVSGFYPVLEDHAGNLWTVNDDDELMYYDRQTEKFYLHNITKSNIYGVPKSNAFESFIPSAIVEDKSGQILITMGNGVLAIDTKQKPFKANNKGGNNPAFSISDISIAHLNQHGQGPESVCENLFNLLDRKNKIYSSFTFADYGDPNRHNVFYKDSKGVLWIVASDLGIASYDPATKKNHQYSIEGNADPGMNRGFSGIAEDLKGQFWACSYRNGIYKLDTSSGMFRKYNPKRKNEFNFTDFSYTAIFRDSKGILYLATNEQGLVTFNTSNETFTVYHHDPNDPASISCETVCNFFEGKNRLIWFGTDNQGINVFNPATGKFRSFPTDNQLQNFVCFVTEDRKGNYWIGGRYGMSSFTPPDDAFAQGTKIEFRNYNKNDGLPADFISKNCAFCDTDGTLYFATRGGGIFYFNPDSLKDNDFIPPVYITEFRLRNKLVNVNDSNTVLKSAVEYTKEIQLNYKENDISFSFAALNYIHPEKNQYAYMLEGYDKDWIFTDASQRFASYTNLDPKKYIFKVKATNNDGKWNETPTELKIIITPPFWKTAWFKFLVAFVAASLIYAFYRYRVGQIILLQRIRNKIAADLHDDIGSTLNSISVYSEVAKKDAARKDFALGMIGESSRKIIDSMSDIVWSINPENDSFDKLIFRMRSLTYNLLKAKKIDCTFKADEKLNELKLSMQIRRNFYLIFKEALNNLVKYSKACRASVMLTHENRQVVLIIRDDGIGFDPDIKYNGNGINNIRKRANEINAKLIIESSAGKGSTIELNLKV